MGQINDEEELENDDVRDNFFDPELEGILKTTAQIPVTDHSPKSIDNIGLRQLKSEIDATQPILIDARQPITTKNAVSKVENTIKEILSRKDTIPLKASINIQVYDKKTFKFLLDLFDKDLSQEEIVDIIIKSLYMEDIKNSIKGVLSEYYHKSQK